MKNHFTKESFVIIIFSFQVQPRKAIGKMILFPLICTRLTEKCRKFQGKKLSARNFESEKEGKHSDQTTEFTHLVIFWSY